MKARTEHQVPLADEVVALLGSCVLPMKPVPMRPILSLGFSAGIQMLFVDDQGRVDPLIEEVDYVLYR